MCPCISHINMLRSIRRCAMSNLVNEMLCRTTPIKYNNKNYYISPNYDIGNGNSRQNCNYHNHHHHLQNGEFCYCFRRLNSISNPFLQTVNTIRTPTTSTYYNTFKTSNIYYQFNYRCFN